MSKRVLLAMSGGVDSCAAMVLLLKQGYQVDGVTLLLNGMNDADDSPECIRAKQAAEQFHIPHSVLDWRDLFFEKVITPFTEAYKNGFTPNPCIFCNISIKFGKLFEYAIENGYDYLATGHYAKIFYNDITKRYSISKSSYPQKDQSYVLYGLSQEVLSHTILPLGDYKKEEIRKIASDNNLISASAKDSQDICFIPNGDYTEFLTNSMHIKLHPGSFVDMNNHVIGKHKDQLCYTIGQRKGIGIALGKPAYVISKDSKTNTVKLGDNEDLFSNELIASDLNWMSIPELNSSILCTVKIRYSQTESSAELYPLENGNVKVCFKEKQRAITPGQSVVFYDNDSIIGGGIIIQK